MSARISIAMFVVAALLLASCGKESTPPENGKTVEPLASAPTPAPELPAPVVAEEESGAPAGTDSVTGFHGFGPARFGDDEESVRIAWGRPMAFDRVATADAPCTYLRPDPAPSRELSIAFMFDRDRFVRYDINGAGYEAPGGGRVGNGVDALKALYASRYEEQPHKYVEGGSNLVVEGPVGSGSKLIFEIDAGGKVTSWRIGVPPQVDYVEGCG